jgi:hypothetical protein
LKIETKRNGKALGREVSAAFVWIYLHAKVDEVHVAIAQVGKICAMAQLAQ